MDREEESLGSLQAKLWKASCQVRALGEVLLFQHREPAIDEEDVWHGYGTLLREIGERMERWSRSLDEISVKQAQRKRKARRSK